jgi:hypothetical protein
MRLSVAQCGIIYALLFTLNVNDIPTPSRHVQLDLYADDTSRQTALLVKYLSQRASAVAEGRDALR